MTTTTTTMMMMMFTPKTISNLPNLLRKSWSMYVFALPTAVTFSWLMTTVIASDDDDDDDDDDNDDGDDDDDDDDDHDVCTFKSTL